MLLPCLSLLSDQPTCDSSSHGSKCHNCSGPVCTRSTDYTNSRLSRALSPGHSPMVAAKWSVLWCQMSILIFSRAVFLVLSKHYMVIAILKQLSVTSPAKLLDMMEKKLDQFMRNSIHASIIIVLMRSYTKLTRTEISVDYSYLHTGVFVHCLKHVQWHRLLKCPTPAAASSQWIRALFPPFTLRFLLLVSDEVARSKVAVGTPVHVRRQQSGASYEDHHPSERTAARVKRTPSLREAIRDRDHAMTDQQSHVRGMQRNTQPQTVVIN